MRARSKHGAITPRTRARARHILDHYYIGPARDQDVLEIWGYTPKLSYFPGEQVDLCVSTTAAEWDLEIGRDGSDYVACLEESGLEGQHQDTPEDCSVTGCGWQPSYSFVIPQDWRPGGYLVTLRARSGEDQVEEHHVFLVRQSPETENFAFVLVCASSTWLAYNCWGGSNHYEGITGENGDAFSPVLSTQRPWSRGFCKLPEGAPRAVPEHQPRPGDMVRYPYMEWAYSYGYSKKYASAGWASYERYFARWAEQEGYAFDFVTQHDLHGDPDLLKRYRCAVFVGHDEYWSAAMRDAVDEYVRGGGRVARFGGNFLWQVRLEDEGRRQVCYKYEATQRDPVVGTADGRLTTGAWESPEVNRPGALTFGVNGLRGIYAELGNCTGSGAGGFTVYRPEHWAFAGTGLGYGDVLGASSRIFGYEVDGLDYRFVDGLPFPAGTDGAAQEIEILAMGLATNVETDRAVWGETLYIGASDAEFRAKTLSGEITPETLATSSRGSGMMVSWRTGLGDVFASATCEWVMGLHRKDLQVEQVTRNVLDRFGYEGGTGANVA